MNRKNENSNNNYNSQGGTVHVNDVGNSGGEDKAESSSSSALLQSYSRSQLMELMKQYEQQQLQQQERSTIDTGGNDTNTTTKRSLRTLIGREASLRKPFVIVPPNSSSNEKTNHMYKRTKTTGGSGSVTTNTWIPPLPLPTTSDPSLVFMQQQQQQSLPPPSSSSDRYESSAFQPISYRTASFITSNDNINNRRTQQSQSPHPLNSIIENKVSSPTKEVEVVSSFQELSLQHNIDIPTTVQRQSGGDASAAKKKKHRTYRIHNRDDQQHYLAATITTPPTTSKTQLDVARPNSNRTLVSQHDEEIKVNVYGKTATSICGVHPSRRLDSGIDDSCIDRYDDRYPHRKSYSSKPTSPLVEERNLYHQPQQHQLQEDQTVQQLDRIVFQQGHPESQNVAYPGHHPNDVPIVNVVPVTVIPVPVPPPPIARRQTSGLTSSSFATTNASGSDEHNNDSSMRNNNVGDATFDDDVVGPYHVDDPDDVLFIRNEANTIKSPLTTSSSPSNWSYSQKHEEQYVNSSSNSSSDRPRTNNNSNNTGSPNEASTDESSGNSMNCHTVRGEHNNTTIITSVGNTNLATISSLPIRMGDNERTTVNNSSSDSSKRSTLSSRHRQTGGSFAHSRRASDSESLLLHRQSSTTTTTSSIGNCGSGTTLLPPITLQSSNSRRSILSWGSNFTSGTRKSSQYSIKTSTSSRTGTKSTGAAELEWLYNHSNNKWTNSTASFSRQSSIASAATTSSSFASGMVRGASSRVSGASLQQNNHRSSSRRKHRPSTPPDLIRNITNATVRQIRMSSSSSSSASPEQAPESYPNSNRQTKPQRKSKSKTTTTRTNHRHRGHHHNHERPNNPIAVQMMESYYNGHNDSFQSCTSTTTDLHFMTTDSVGSI